MTAGSSIVAMSCIRPAQRGQRRTSKSNARRMSAPTSSSAAARRRNPPARPSPLPRLDLLPHHSPHGDKPRPPLATAHAGRVRRGKAPR
jgi:hypothetical protein